MQAAFAESSAAVLRKLLLALGYDTVRPKKLEVVMLLLDELLL